MPDALRLLAQRIPRCLEGSYSPSPLPALLAELAYELLLVATDAVAAEHEHESLRKGAEWARSLLLALPRLAPASVRERAT